MMIIKGENEGNSVPPESRIRPIPGAGTAPPRLLEMQTPWFDSDQMDPILRQQST